ncbi:MAG: hexitol phosphatase HxpB [Chitinophagia bacterium]|jgi:sugar-phosphatase|nr:hexitol phosphatase HxpB [Chitinophagia bacterium]NCA29416.1 hexitol phosphatase HxpB [Chitinophagia bacterium]
MEKSAVIFDIDGLLINSEPLWNQAAAEIFRQYGIILTEEQYAITTGLRSKEFVTHWLIQHKIPSSEFERVEEKIIQLALNLIDKGATLMPGVEHIFQFFLKRNFKIGLATSSPVELIEWVKDKLGIRSFIHASCSAQHLPYAKPHPQVYLDCASAMHVSPLACICFEDSVYGMTAAKAARMTCVVVPAAEDIKLPHWGLADLKLSSLQNFGDLHFNMLNH